MLLNMQSRAGIATGGGLTPSFIADLQSSLVPGVFAGSSTPTFTRATTATVLAYSASAVVTDSPVFITVASGEARFQGARRISEGVWSSYDANGVFLSTTNGASALCCDADGPFGYLPEVARTNLQIYSQAYDAGSDTVQGGGATNNISVAPDGTTTMCRITEDTNTSTHRIFSTNGVTITDGATCTISVYLKDGDRRYVTLGAGDLLARRFYACVDLTDGVITEAAALAGGTYSGSTIEELPGGIYRVTVIGKVAAGQTTLAHIISGSNTATPGDASPSYLGSGKVFYWWGRQVENNATFATTYTPTTTAAVTRNGEIDAYATAGNLNAAAMTIALDYVPENDTMGTVFMFGSYVDASNYTAILHDGTNVIARKRIGGANNDATIALDYSANTAYRIAARFDATNGVDVWVDGAKGTNDTETAACQLGAAFQVGADGNSLQQACGSVRRLAVYPQGLSDAQAAAL